jgi:hypothetical protein
MTLLLSLLLSTVLLNPQATENIDQKSSIFDIIYREGEVKLEIETDLALLERNKNTENYQPATIKFKDVEGNKQQWNVEVRPRGRFRRRVCNFPPIKMKFDKDELKEQDYKKHNELKLVTHCLRDAEGKENLLREFLVYQLYEKISPVHYRTQLVRIKYIDQNTGKKKNRYGILMEDENELAARFDTDLCEDCYSRNKDNFYKENLLAVELFQYMIGNSDWSIPMVRNIKLLEDEKTEEEKFYVVPYDFDFSGLVNASYAIPSSSQGLTSVRDRVFLGFEMSEEELQVAAQPFREKRAEIMETVDSFQYLSRSSRNDIKAYLSSFYDQLEKGTIFGEVEDEE